MTVNTYEPGREELAEWLGADEVTRQILIQLQKVNVLAVQRRKGVFTFPLADYALNGRSKQMLGNPTIEPANLHFPFSRFTAKTYSSRKNLEYLVTTGGEKLENGNGNEADIEENEPDEEAEEVVINEGIVSEGIESESDLPDKIKKQRTKSLYLLGRGELIVKKGCPDDIAELRQLKLLIYHQEPYFSGVQILGVWGENESYAFSPLPELETILRAQNYVLVERRMHGLEKELESARSELVRVKAQLSQTEYGKHKLEQDKQKLLQQNASETLLGVLDRIDISSPAGRLYYALAKSLVAKLIQKSEFSEAGIVLDNGSENPLIVRPEHYVCKEKRTEENLFRFGGDGSNPYYTGFGELYGPYISANKMSEDQLIPPWMLKLMQMEDTVRKQVPRITPKVLASRFGFNPADLEQALDYGWIEPVKDNSYLKLDSIKKTMAQLYPYVEKYHSQFLKETLDDTLKEA